MAKKVRSLLIIGLLLSLLEYTHAQSELNHNIQSDYGSQGMNEESWDERATEGDPDYLTVEFEGEGGRINLADEITGCVGFTTAKPSYVIQWQRTAIEEHKRLRLFLYSRSDTSLAIRNPAGEWLCSDNSYGTNHPTIDIRRPRTGRYSIWAGLPATGASLNATLYITPGSYTPDNPPLTLEPNFLLIGRASGIAHGEIIYVEAFDRPSQLMLSVDVQLVGMDGHQEVRLVAWPVDPDSGERILNSDSSEILSEVIFTPRFNTSSYDYLNGEPLALDLQDGLFAIGQSYEVDLRLQIMSERGDWEDLDSYDAHNQPALRHTV